MILQPKETYVAYRCPYCGEAVIGFVGSFALSADMLRLKCPCGESHMRIEVTREKKIRLSVPCLFCERDHSYILSQELFYGKEVFLLNCVGTGLDIGVIGSEEKVRQELVRTEEELKKIFEEIGVGSPADILRKKPTPEELLPDAQIYDIVRFVVKELEAEGAVSCPCQSGSYDIEMLEGGIRVYCPECHAEYIFPANSVSAAQEFLQCDRIELK